MTLAISSADRVNGVPALADVKPLHLEPRCRICRNDKVRAAVNEMLSTGATYAVIVRHVNDPDADPRDRVTIDSVRNHSARHFPVQNVAPSTYREILERRAQANGVDFVNSVGTALTPMAYLETVMAKGYQTLLDPDTKVDVNTAMTAASRLQALVDARAGQPDMLKLTVQLGRIIEAVRSTVPREMWAEITEKLEDGVCSELIDDTGDDDFDDYDLGELDAGIEDF